MSTSALLFLLISILTRGWGWCKSYKNYIILIFLSPATPFLGPLFIWKISENNFFLCMRFSPLLLTFKSQHKVYTFISTLMDLKMFFNYIILSINFTCFDWKWKKKTLKLWLMLCLLLPFFTLKYFSMWH